MGLQWTHTDFADRSIVEVGEILNRSFEDYMAPFQFTPQLVARMMRSQGVDLLESRLLLANGEPAGAAMIARRGTHSRVASLGVYKAFRNQGGARYLMNTVIAEAKARQDTVFELEAVEGNDKAIALYENLGFRRIRFLVGFEGEGLHGENEPIEPISLQEAARMIGCASVPDAPWMLAGAALAYCRQPCEAYRYGKAAAIVIPQKEEAVELKALPMTSDRRIGKDTESLILGLQHRFRERKWHAGPFQPDDLVSTMMLNLGFRHAEMKQAQWRLDLR